MVEISMEYLPEDCLIEICLFLPVTSILNLMSVGIQFQPAKSTLDHLWSRLIERDFSVCFSQASCKKYRAIFAGVIANVDGKIAELGQLLKNFHTLEICLAAVSRNGMALQFVENRFRTPNLYLAAVRQNGLALQFIEDQFQLAGSSYIKEQTQDTGLAAVHQNGKALIYVKEQTQDLCLAAVQQTGEAICYVKKQTPDLCLAAVRQNGHSLWSVKERFQSQELCLEAGLQIREARRRKAVEEDDTV